MTRTLPQTIPCPFEAIPGAEIKHGPRKGKCSYRAELMGQLTDRPYYRCLLHGTIPNRDTTAPATAPAP
jgi:hypothetical protein